MLRESLLLSSSAPDEEKPKKHSQESLVSSSSPSPSASASSGKKAILPPTRKLEITSISAEALLDGRKPVKKKAFVSFQIAENPGATVRTRADEVGGDYPTWEDKLETEFSLPSERERKESFMYVGVYCQVSGGMDRKVGTARVPLKDFTGGYAPEGFLHCLSYRLWDEYGKRNGVVNFSARIVPVNKGAGLSSFWLR